MSLSEIQINHSKLLINLFFLHKGLYMNKFTINFSDYLFIQFRTLTPTLEDVCKTYYPRLSREKILEKARKAEFPFPCYRLDPSQKATYFVNLFELSDFLLDALQLNQQYINTDLQHACSDNS